ncbi:hypothetical protein PPERSA_05361 [Pseudocohnilembus persalinus]|uniref:Uncharacterized protein n=1 Tax=Pseudocohnilembus persalinus TaxID=266149 RepID=A0A0V0R7Q1_PSEPJ|nr:hypothetical protein PPERSA_05361 [Pseudocohnilembus persalinus]|eukprot:KRX10541.1 hypothetical protein PPERSA_05361 [Pseudocohnilembus persalinus]
MKFPYHLTEQNDNILIQPFQSEYSCTDNPTKLQKLDIYKLSKQVNDQKYQAVKNVEKKLQKALNNKFPSDCQYAVCSLLTLFVCSIPAMIWYQKSKQKLENIIQNWLNESNRYLEQYGVQVFRKKLQIKQKNLNDQQMIIQELDYLIYTFTDEENHKMIDQIDQSSQITSKFCIFANLAQYRNDILSEYQSPDIQNQNFYIQTGGQRCIRQAN